MPTNHDETLYERYAREQRELELAVSRKAGMNTEELKRLALAAKDDPDGKGVWQNWEAAANPAAILSLIEEREVLLEALNRLIGAYSTSHTRKTRDSAWEQARAAIAKVES